MNPFTFLLSFLLLTPEMNQRFINPKYMNLFNSICIFQFNQRYSLFRVFLGQLKMPSHFFNFWSTSVWHSSILFKYHYVLASSACIFLNGTSVIVSTFNRIQLLPSFEIVVKTKATFIV